MAARDRQQGFTLGEVLSVVGIVGLSLSLAAPSLSSAINANQRARAVNELVATLHTAHSAAITRNRQITVCPSTDGRQCDGEAWERGWIQFVDEDRDHRVDAGEEILGSVAGAAPFRVRSPEFSRYLAYLPTGRVTGDDDAGFGGRFEFCHGANAVEGRVLAVTGAGAPILIPADGEAGIPDCPPLRPDEA
jgi:type IV fimbrial biogenesis protein FimT